MTRRVTLGLIAASLAAAGLAGRKVRDLQRSLGAGRRGERLCADYPSDAKLDFLEVIPGNGLHHELLDTVSAHRRSRILQSLTLKNSCLSLWR